MVCWSATVVNIDGVVKRVDFDCLNGSERYAKVYIIDYLDDCFGRGHQLLSICKIKK